MQGPICWGVPGLDASGFVKGHSLSKYAGGATAADPNPKALPGINGLSLMLLYMYSG
jgi:hypothetical protein